MGPDGVVVCRDEGGWAVTASQGRSEIYETQDEAVAAARALVQSKGGGLRIQGDDGVVREGYRLGRDPFLSVSAVEGIALVSDARDRAERFDRAGLSPGERREAIIRAHRPRHG